MLSRKERAQVEEALFHLMDNEGADFAKGIGMLCELLGKRYPAYHDTRNARTISLKEIWEIPVGEFRFPGDDQ